MKIFITGGTGFIGMNLVPALVGNGHQVTILSRSGGNSPGAGIEKISGNPMEPGEWQAEMKRHDAVVNLAGSSIFCRWTAKNRRRIIDSRLRTTNNITAALNESDSSVHTLVSASAIGIYGDTGDREVTETDPAGSDFLAEVAGNWEQAAQACTGARVALCRTGLVLGNNGGALTQMLPVFRAGLGSPLGSGRQWWSWIHIADLVEGIRFMIENSKISGPVNLTAPNPVSNSSFSSALASALQRPFFLPALPSFLLRAVLGQTSSLLLNSNRVIPAVLINSGFTFRFTEVENALADLV